MVQINRLVRLLSPASEDSAKWRHHAEGSANNVSKSDRDKVFQQKCLDCDISTTEHTQRNDEHVSNTVIKTKSDKGGNWEVDSSHLARHGGTARCHVHSHANQPVAEKTANESNVPWKRALGSGNGSRSWAGRQSTALEGKIGQEKRPHKVSCIRSNPVLDQIFLFDFPFLISSSNKGRISGEEFSSGNQSHDKAERQPKASKNDLLKTRIFGSNSWACSSNSDGEVRPECNMATGDNAKFENIYPRLRSFSYSSSHSTLIQGGRGLELGWGCSNSTSAHAKGGRSSHFRRFGNWRARLDYCEGRTGAS
mmetsp:Transcript_9090/g.18870  ORF Transcript_9090/g.18870 Transcript_9090/m.18870 type:complete len:309 (+) Transcript_9090:1066-1992(+)